MKNIIIVILLGIAIFLGLLLKSHSQRDPVPPSSRPPSRPLNSMLEAQVFLDLVASHSKGNDGFYEVFFLDSNDTEYLKLLFKNSNPRVDVGTNNLVIDEKGVFDKLTKKRGKLLWAKVQSVSNNVAEINAGWYTSPVGAQNIQYRLELKGTNWIIISRKITLTS